jgi:hypothetical protein
LPRGKLGVVAIAVVASVTLLGLEPANAVKAPTPVITPQQAQTIATSFASRNNQGTRQAPGKAATGPAFAIEHAYVATLKAVGQPPEPGSWRGDERAGLRPAAILLSRDFSLSRGLCPVLRDGALRALERQSPLQ